LEHSVSQSHRVPQQGEKHARDLLIEAAKSVFARKSYEGATVKELAEFAGVNVSLVSYYFGGKEGLYRACLENFGHDRLAAAQRVLKTPRSREDFRVRLRLFVEEFLDCHLEQPDICLILHRECASDMAVTKDLFKDIFVKVFETLVLFLATAQTEGILRQECDPRISANLFFGGLVHALRTDPLFEEIYCATLKDRAYREKFIETALSNLWNGIMK